MHRAHFIALISLIAIATVAGSVLRTEAAPVGSLALLGDGAFDLRAWDPHRDGPVQLSTGWNYFDRRWAGQLETDPAKPLRAAVPGPWPVTTGGSKEPRYAGFGTYRLRISLPQPPAGEHYAIDTGQVLSAYRLYANGRLIAESGRPSADRAGEMARAYSRMAIVPYIADQLVLDLELSNHLGRYGGIFVAPRLGLEQDIFAHREFVETLSLILVGTMLFAALYHLSAFAIMRQWFGALAFGLFALLMGARTMLIEPLAAHMVPFVGQDWVWRLDYAASMLILPAAYWFFASTFPRQMPHRFIPWVAGFSAGAAALTLIAGPVTGEFALKVFEVAALFALVFLTIALARATRAGEHGAGLALIGWLISAATVVHDILIDQGAVSGINLIPFGFVAFFLCLSGSLVTRFYSTYRSTERLTKDLGALNEGLETLAGQRTSDLRAKVQELKGREIELECARSDAVAASLAKSRFLAAMSHELRTPLNAILGFSELIKNQIYGPTGDPGEYARLIGDSGAHLLSLVCDILDLSKIEAGKMELHPETLSVEEVLAEALKLAVWKAKPSEGRIKTQIAPRLPLLRADRRAVTQMIVNLVSNALKFTPESGEIIIASGVRNDGGISIAVRDTGIGIAAMDIPKALAMFSQVDDGTARKHEGSGLGLPIVKSLIELHGGSLTLDSALGIGTTAAIAFPPARTIDIEVRQKAS